MADRGFDQRSGQTRDYEIVIWCFLTNHTVLRSKSKYWWARSQDVCLPTDCWFLFCRHVMEGLEGTQFTCVACHPTDLCVVTGCQNGRIYYWYDYNYIKLTIIIIVL